MTNLSQGFPQINSPWIDPETGIPNQTFLQLIITLFNRTGGPSGDVDFFDAASFSGRVEDQQERIVNLETPQPTTGQFLELQQQIQDAALLSPPERPVTSLQGRSVGGDSPSDQDVLTWDATRLEWAPAAAQGGSGNGMLPLCTGVSGPVLMDDGTGQCIGVPL